MTRGLRALLLLAACSLASACSRPLPEEGSPDAQLYRARCATCHAAYQPSAMTPTMWRLQFDRMQQKYANSGYPLPTPAEREQILKYIDRHVNP